MLSTLQGLRSAFLLSRHDTLLSESQGLSVKMPMFPCVPVYRSAAPLLSSLACSVSIVRKGRSSVSHVPRAFSGSPISALSVTAAVGSSFPQLPALSSELEGQVELLVRLRFTSY